MFDWQQVRYWNDFLWIWYSNIVMMVPMTILFFYKLLNPIDWNTLIKPGFKTRSDFGDKLLTIISLYCILYYIVDSIVKIMNGNYTEGCDFSMFFHHIVSFILIPRICFVRHWTWFLIGPAAMHTFLLAFPEETWLNYIYLTLILCLQYGLYQKPFSNIAEYRRIRIGVILVEVACVLLWWFDCSNRLLDLPVSSQEPIQH